MQITHVFRTEVQMSTPSFGGKKFGTLVLWAPPYAAIDLFFFLFRGNFGSSKTQIFQKKLEKKLNDWEGAYRTRVPIFGFRLQKNGVDIGCRTNLGRYAWTTLYHESVRVRGTYNMIFMRTTIIRRIEILLIPGTTYEKLLLYILIYIDGIFP